MSGFNFKLTHYLGAPAPQHFGQIRDRAHPFGPRRATTSLYRKEHGPARACEESKATNSFRLPKRPGQDLWPFVISVLSVFLCGEDSKAEHGVHRRSTRRHQTRVFDLRIKSDKCFTPALFFRTYRSYLNKCCTYSTLCCIWHGIFLMRQRYRRRKRRSTYRLARGRSSI